MKNRNLYANEKRGLSPSKEGPSAAPSEGSGGSPPWQVSQATYLAGRAHLDGADAMAHDMETKWGVGRLRLLVSPELREKFDRQRVKLNEALIGGDVADVQREADRMVNAWHALDRAAEAAGACLAEHEVGWEVALSDGRVLTVLRYPIGRCLNDGRHVETITLAEVARLYEGFPELVKVKQVFPGATVERVRRIQDPLESWEQTDLNDEIGF